MHADTDMHADTATIADLVLQTDTGDDQRLGDLWGDGPAVLVWLRHFG